MGMTKVLALAELPLGAKKTIKAGETEILLLHLDSGVAAVEAKCPHAGAPLEKGALCNKRLVCPWHLGTFALPGGELVEPPAMRPLKTYAVSIADGDVYVDPQPLPDGRADNVPSGAGVVLLVGAGAAGAMAAVSLRQYGYSGRIVAVDPVADEPVDRTQLTKQVLAGKMPLNKAAIDALADAAVERVQAAVVELSAAQGVARLSNGDTVRFDQALVATGGQPKWLEVPGAEHAHTIRHADDVRKILAAAEGKQRAAVIGTSFIGLEAASALVQKGLQVTVVGREDLPFAKRFGPEVARAMMAFHQSKGTRFCLGAEVAAVRPDGVAVRVNGQEERVEADLVVMGVGVGPALGFMHDLPPAEEGGGIAVTPTLRAAGSVWVAGDIANVEGTRIEHWRLAEQHGQVAAHGMLADGVLRGESVARYQGVPFFWTTHYGKRLGYLGHAERWDEVVTDGDLAQLEFLSFYLQKGVVKAVLSCGRDTQTAALAEAMRTHLSVAEAREIVRAAG